MELLPNEEEPVEFGEYVFKQTEMVGTENALLFVVTS